jgi:hypothetical protein
MINAHRVQKRCVRATTSLFRPLRSKKHPPAGLRVDPLNHAVERLPGVAGSRRKKRLSRGLLFLALDRGQRNPDFAPIIVAKIV